jgi:predicted DNA-binding transcriptional regulator AlpA
MPTRWLRFSDLKAAGLVNSWPMLKRRIERDGFPRGRMLGPNTRAWSEAEVQAWLDSRPIAGPAPRGAAKAKQVLSAKAPPG